MLLRALHAAGEASDDMVSPLARVRLRLAMTVPAVRGCALQVPMDAQQQIATHVAEAFPSGWTASAPRPTWREHLA